MNSYEKGDHQYQTTDNMTQLISQWSVLDMIPKSGVEYIKRQGSYSFRRLQYCQDILDTMAKTSDKELEPPLLVRQ